MFRGSLVALVTPMLESGVIDLAAFEVLLDWQLEQGSDGVVVLGTTGEAPTLTLEEGDELLRRAVQRLGGRIPVLAGTGTSATATTVARTRRACEIGVDGVLVVTPYYNKPSQSGLLAHFVAVAEASSVPVLLYNVPARTACDLLPATVGDLARHPRIVGIKDATPDPARLAALIAAGGDDFLVFSGDDAASRSWMLGGAQGVVSVTANVAPALVRELCEASLEGDLPRALALEQRLAALNQALFVEANPIPAKWALARLGLIQPGIRLPLTPLDAAHHARVEEAMKQAGIL